MGGGESAQHCMCLLASVVVCAEAFSNKCSTQYMHATLQPPSVHLRLLPSLTQTLSSLFLSSTKHQFSVLPIKAYIHAANYEWHDSFGLVPVPLISPLPFPSSYFGRAHWKSDYQSMSHPKFCGLHMACAYKFYLGVSLHVQIVISHWWRLVLENRGMHFIHLCHFILK